MTDSILQKEAEKIYDMDFPQALTSEMWRMAQNAAIHRAAVRIVQNSKSNQCKAYEADAKMRDRHRAVQHLARRIEHAIEGLNMKPQDQSAAQENS